ncbi:MAG: signal peptide peptidase SppA, partial [Alphaproteobacteria bacterium]|nr:signal peptide peptidase SppA [Alphaproteobacteria bacterium]
TYPRQELRAAIAELRGAGKPARIFTEDLGGLGGGSATYYLASAFDEIWVQPSGGVGLIGIAMEIPYAKGLLDKLEVEPRFGQRHEYKSSVESFTRYGMSDSARENLQTLLDSLYEQLVAGISESRGFDEAEVRQLIDNGPYLAQEALEKGLIDRIGYWDEFIDANLEAAGDEAEKISLEDYLAGIDRPNSEGPKVALIYGTGAISMGGGSDDGDFESSGFKAHSVADSLADATDDDNVKAILFRVDSPGGSYIASDIVWREVRRASAAGKPVIVSMGGVAASGGYFVAMPADRIVAQPGTVTGSIGVYGGKFVTEKLWARFGVKWDQLHAGENAGMWSLVRDFPTGGEERFREMLDFIYADFTAKAMEDREIDTAQMDRIARGRVWTGKDALDNGLIDALGGYDVAIAEVKKALGLEPEAGITLALWPKPRSPFDELMALFSSDGKPLAQFGATLFGKQEAGIIAEVGDRLGLPAEDLELLQPPAGVLQLPPMQLRY